MSAVAVRPNLRQRASKVHPDAAQTEGNKVVFVSPGQDNPKYIKVLTNTVAHTSYILHTNKALHTSTAVHTKSAHSPAGQASIASRRTAGKGKSTPKQVFTLIKATHPQARYPLPPAGRPACMDHRTGERRRMRSCRARPPWQHCRRVSAHGGIRWWLGLHQVRLPAVRMQIRPCVTCSKHRGQVQAVGSPPPQLWLSPAQGTPPIHPCVTCSKHKGHVHVGPMLVARLLP